MILINGKRYKANVKLSFFQSITTNGQIESKLRDAGFTDVYVTGSGSTRSASGVWGKSSQNVAVPSQLTDVTEA